MKIINTLVKAPSLIRSRATGEGGGASAPCASSDYDRTPCGADCLGDEAYTATEYADPASNSDRWFLRKPIRARSFGVCGEMVADPKAAILLLGLSFNEFSASPASVPDIKIALRSVRYAFVSVLPIGLVVIGVYAFMAMFGYTVNVVTSTIAAVAVGVGIDFSTHFTARFREELAGRGGLAELGVVDAHDLAGHQCALRLDGYLGRFHRGAARSALLREMLTARSGRSVRSGPAEATALGNALTQGIALGVFADQEEARSSLAPSRGPGPPGPGGVFRGGERNRAGTGG